MRFSSNRPRGIDLAPTASEPIIMEGMLRYAVLDGKKVIKLSTQQTRVRSMGAVLVVFVAAIGSTAPAATRTSGIYLTALDYQKAQLTSEGDCKSDAHKLELHDVLNKPFIDVTHDSDHHRYLKSEIFGFRACDGLDYRFVQNKEYRIVEARTLYIYVVQAPARLGKDTARDLNTVSTYYFSVGGEGDVLPLTLINLKRAFPANHAFHDSLDAAFPFGGVEQYDEFHKMFKVNHLLESSAGR
jgi:hypothetical protein